MHPSIQQVNKKKMVTRFSMAVYKMTDEQLSSLLNLFKELKIDDINAMIENFTFQESGAGGVRNRQLLIARIFMLIHQLTEADFHRFMRIFEQKRFATLRQHPRVPCQIILDLAADDRAINCFAMDISAGGIFVESWEPFALNQRLLICFPIDEDQLTLKLKGRVIRQEHDGVGVQFESITDYQVEIMKDLVNRLHQKISPQ